MPTRIRRLLIRDYQQFRDTLLDFTDPDGNAAKRICFIGRNGTGKTTILRLLNHAVMEQLRVPEQLILEAARSAETCAVWNDHGAHQAVDATEDIGGLYERHRTGDATRRFREVETWLEGGLLVDVLAEASRNDLVGLNDVPETSLSDALVLEKGMAFRHEVSNATVREMWRLFVYLVKKRESDRQVFETREENLEKTKRQLIEEFDADNRSVLDELAVLWDRILEPAGLKFDIERARIPVQLNENLHAYVVQRSTGRRVPYGALSTGMRNFLFRVGHLFLLYFNREVDPGFVLIDEPENSLFPDFLFELTSILDDIVGDTTQLFVATHSPIVAAQFEPHERIILDFDDDHYVVARKGTAPVGDDPNDVLRQDFGLPHVMGPKGREAWDRYVELRKQIRKAPPDRKDELVDEAAELGRRYGFAQAK